MANLYHNSNSDGWTPTEARGIQLSSFHEECVDFHPALSSKHFLPIPQGHGTLLDMSADDFPTNFDGIDSKVASTLELSSGTHFGYILEGAVDVKSKHGLYHLCSSTYFCIPGPASLYASSQTRGFIATRHNYAGQFLIGGQVTPGPGRISYIDNASTDLLVHPAEVGAPCFNKLFFPAHQRQTPHTHPSFRMTCAINGEGFCEVPDLPPIRITRGVMFVIPAGGVHAINTRDQSLTLITFHPESVGPGNPMLDSTIMRKVESCKHPGI